MAIPSEIQREHIFQAMLRIKQEGIPKRRHAREWAVQYDGEQYPCKLLISWANFYALGYELDPNPNIFQTFMAQEYLQSKNFEVIAV